MIVDRRGERNRKTNISARRVRTIDVPCLDCQLRRELLAADAFSRETVFPLCQRTLSSGGACHHGIESTATATSTTTLTVMTTTAATVTLPVIILVIFVREDHK